MSYNALADEIILQIAGYITPSEIEQFAYINSRTYRIAHDQLMQRLRPKHNASAMIHRFGQPTRILGLCVVDPTNYIPRFPKLHKYTAAAAGTLADLDYLQLNGDLHWLQPLDDDTNKMHVWPRGVGAPQSYLDDLVASAQKVGVKIPAAFLSFMGSTELIERMYLGGDYFAIGPELVKCRPEHDSNGGGYVIRFLCDQQGCLYWALYMAPGGYQCVLDMPDDVNDLRGREEENLSDGRELMTVETTKSIPMARYNFEATLGHPDFESWLAMRYFDGWCSATLGQGKELVERQRVYLDHFWRTTQD